MTKYQPRQHAPRKKYQVIAKPTWYDLDKQPVDQHAEEEPVIESSLKRFGMQRHPATNIIYNMDMDEIPDGGFQL